MTPAIVIAVYILFLLVFGTASFLALYQLWHFGYVGDSSSKMLLIYLGIATAIIIITFLLYFVLRKQSWTK